MHIAIIIITTEKLSSGIISSPWNVIFKNCLFLCKDQYLSKQAGLIKLQLRFQ